MEIVLFLFGLLLGGLISWGITHAYYNKASHDQNLLFNKLSEEVRDAILNDSREKLSVLELNELIREKTIDGDIAEPSAYTICPRCGSENLQMSSDAEVGYGGDGPELECLYDMVRCKKCNWTKTSHGFESPRDGI